MTTTHKYRIIDFKRFIIYRLYQVCSIFAFLWPYFWNFLSNNNETLSSFCSVFLEIIKCKYTERSDSQLYFYYFLGIARCFLDRVLLQINISLTASLMHLKVCDCIFQMSGLPRVEYMFQLTSCGSSAHNYTDLRFDGKMTESMFNVFVLGFLCGRPD